MGKTVPYQPSKLVIGILIPSEEIPGELAASLETLYGEIESRGGPYPFRFTDYYEPEMGDGLNKFFLVFRELVTPERLADIKLETNVIEAEYLNAGNRRLNLDPGVITSSNLILATTKERGHRIPIGKNLYGELTLIYMKGDFQPLPWTYADFRSEEYRQFLKKIRRNYLNQLKEIDKTSS